MHKNWYIHYLVLLTYMKHMLVFVNVQYLDTQKYALCDLKYSRDV